MHNDNDSDCNENKSVNLMMKSAQKFIESKHVNQFTLTKIPCDLQYASNPVLILFQASIFAFLSTSRLLFLVITT